MTWEEAPRKMRVEDFSDLVANIYDCPGDFSRWPAVLQKIADYADIPLIHIFGIYRAGGTPLFSISNLNHSLPKKEFDSLHLASSLARVTLKTVQNSIRTGTLNFPDDTSADGKLVAHLRQSGLTKYAASALLDTDKIKVCVLLHCTALQNRQVKAFSKTIQLLQPHLIRSLQLSERLDTLQYDLSTAWGLIGRLQIGVILIDEDQTILHTNKEADRILAMKDGLSRHRKRLISGSRPGDPGIMELLQQNLTHPEGPASSRQQLAMFSIPRPSGRRPIIIHARHVSSHSPVALAGARAAVSLLLRDLEYPQARHIDAFSHAFKLTPAEQRLIVALITGSTLKSHANAENISQETVRWHLKNIFSKTECRSQASLLNLIHTSIILEN